MGEDIPLKKKEEEAYAPYTAYLSRMQDAGKHRRLPQPRQALPLRKEGETRSFLDFSTNDYLALSRDQRLLEAAHLAGRAYGCGATGARLTSGNTEICRVLEEKIASSKQTEAALILPSGFQTNFSILSALLEPAILGAHPLVFFDRLNHSSLYQAVFLSGAELLRYRHNDALHLSNLLDHYAGDKRKKFIVTETVFGMDGDFAPLSAIVPLARKHQAFLYLDEAHATGVSGPKGYGLSTTIDLEGLPHLIMGSFSKALGSSGGFVASAQSLKDYLINKAAGFMFSTAPSPLVLGAADKAWDLIPTLEMERAHLQNQGQVLRRTLKEWGFDTGCSTTHIVPILLGKEREALAAQERLRQKGIAVSCIRPPTVPPGTARLRIALTAAHTEEEVATLIAELRSL